MIFDLFHSISDPIVEGKRLGAKKAIEQFLDQVVLAESLGFDTAWLAESHFSSETQKKTSVATIPEFHGEVGLNVDSFQFFHLIQERTKKINLGTGIHNIVGGSGGPISSAERVRFLDFANTHFWKNPRTLRMGVASGRFPYQNTPFGILPKNDQEKRAVFLEALEIFLRLLKGEELNSTLTLQSVKQWNFEALRLIPEMSLSKNVEIVLGSSDPEALNVANRFWDVNLFNLSFTPPEQLEKLHLKMSELTQKWGNTWHRSRLPRTVMVFTDPDSKKAHALASFVLDTYIEAMRGTAQVPDKNILLQRALIGDAVEIREQLSPTNPRRFHVDDRLMLWFEFNQLDGQQIESQMKYFANEVIGKL